MAVCMHKRRCLGGSKGVDMDERSHEAGQNNERKNDRDNESGRNIEESAGK